MSYAEIAILTKVRNSQDTFTYQIPTDMNVSVGDFVIVPLQSKTISGLVMNIHNTKPNYATKPIILRDSDQHSLPQIYCNFLSHISTSTLHSISNIAQTWILTKPKRYALKHSQESISFAHQKSSTLHLYNSVAEVAPILESIIKKSQGQVVIVCPRMQEVSALAQSLQHVLPKVHDKKLPSHEQYAFWESALFDDKAIYIGTRSLTTLPFAHLDQLIILDDNALEHIQTEPTPHFSVHQISRFYEQCTNVSYVSHTPSIETMHRVMTKETVLDTSVVSKVHPYKLFLSNYHTQTQTEALTTDAKEYILMQVELGKKIVLLCNKKGLYTGIYCRTCKSTTYDISQAVCPKCKSPTTFPIGKGVDQVRDEIAILFPQFSIDTYTGEKDAKPTAQIVVATEALLYSSYIQEFSAVALLSFESFAGLLANIYDEQHLENIISTIQVHNLELIVQAKENLPSLWHDFCSHDLKRWYAQKIQSRKEYSLPPFAYFITCTYEDTNAKKGALFVEAILSQLKDELPKTCELSSALPKEYDKKIVFEFTITAPHTITLEFLSLIKKHPIKIYSFN